MSKDKPMKHKLQKCKTPHELAGKIRDISAEDLSALHQAEATAAKPRHDMLREINRERNRRAFP